MNGKDSPSPRLQFRRPPTGSGQWPSMKCLLMLALAGLAWLTAFSTCNLRSERAPARDRIVKVAEQPYIIVEKKNSGNSSIAGEEAGDPFELARIQSFGENEKCVIWVLVLVHAPSYRSLILFCLKSFTLLYARFLLRYN